MDAIQNRRNQVSAQLEDAVVSSREMLAEYPLTATLIAFGAGAAIGVLVGQSLATRHEPETTAAMMEKFGRQVAQALHNSLPESISRHLPR
jgi:hypothetical protein